MKKLLVAASLLVALVLSAHARSYDQYVVAHNIVVQHINGQLRFCERDSLKGLICVEQVNVFGKKRQMPRDWWTPETYVEAYAGTLKPTVTRIQPTADGQGMVIYYEPSPEAQPQGFSMY